MIAGPRDHAAPSRYGGSAPEVLRSNILWHRYEVKTTEDFGNEEYTHTCEISNMSCSAPINPSSVLCKPSRLLFRKGYTVRLMTIST